MRLYFLNLEVLRNLRENQTKRLIRFQFLYPLGRHLRLKHDHVPTHLHLVHSIAQLLLDFIRLFDAFNKLTILRIITPFYKIYETNFVVFGL